jgi:saccharopine dehydrogenase (NAD+, L-lysine forming)
MLKIGIIREGKVPPDARTPLTPSQCVEAQRLFPVEIAVAPSPVRSFKDEEYRAAGIALQNDLSDCDVLLGIKEVPVEQLMSHKTYLFFTHTIKKQAHNRGLLQAILAKNIRAIDYEALTDEQGVRLIAFGYYAGMVGAHNALWAFGKRSGAYALPRMIDCHDYAEVKEAYRNTAFPPLRIALSGGGRVAKGAIQTLIDAGIRPVSPQEFLARDFATPVFAQLHAQDYAAHRKGHPFDKKHYYAHGEEYQSVFEPYARRADIFINCIFYDKKAPAFFSVADMRSPDFRIQTIADISCDIMPDASVPCTIRPSKIPDPIYGFAPLSGAETAPFQAGSVDVMAVDNLPSELPRDASIFFGQQFLQNILPELIKKPPGAVIQRATVAENGRLTEYFAYLEDYVGLGFKV